MVHSIQSFICHSNDDRTLLPHTCSRISPCFYDSFQVLILYHIGLELPAASSRFGSFDLIGEENNKRVNGILDDLLKGTFKKGTTEQKLSDLYKLAMDSVRRNNDGVAPAMAVINKLEKAKTKAQLFEVE